MTADLIANLIQANLYGSVAIVLVLLSRRPARRWLGPGLAYALWLIPLCAMAIAFVPAPVGVSPVAAPMAVAAQLALSADFAPSAALLGQAPLRLDLLASWIWLCGVIGLIGFTALNQLRAMRGFGPLARDRDGVYRASRPGCGPAIIGLLRPRIVLPVEFERQFAPLEQAMILTHERTHLTSGHVWLNTLGVAICALNWFNPLVHLAAWCARVDQELACDAAVAQRFPGERRAYAQAMLKSQLSRAPLPLGCAWPSRSNPMLKERIEMLALQTPSLHRRLAGTIAVVLLTTAGAYTAWAAQPPEPPAEEAVVASGAVSLTNAGGEAATFAVKDQAAISAAVSRGDIRQVIALGGEARDVAQILAEDERALARVLEAGGDFRFVNAGGRTGIRAESNDGQYTIGVTVPLPRAYADIPPPSGAEVLTRPSGR